jgi:hypothetical protein
MESLEDGIVLVGHQTGEIDQTSVTLDEGGEHRPVGVDNPITVRPRTGRQQFVAGHDQPNPRLAKHPHFSHAYRTEHSQVLRAQQTSGLEDRRPTGDIFSSRADMFARRHCGECPDASITRCVRSSLRHLRSAADRRR